MVERGPGHESRLQALSLEVARTIGVSAVALAAAVSCSAQTQADTQPETVAIPQTMTVESPSIPDIQLDPGSTFVKAVAMTKRNHRACSLITDKPSGYYIGQACKSDTIIKTHESPSKKYDYGLIKRRGKFVCGWVYADKLRTKSPKTKRQKNICAKDFKERENRYHHGKDFNCGDGKCVAGKTVKLTKTCDNRFYRNFSTRKRSPTNPTGKNKDGFYDYIGKQTDPVSYRFTFRKGDGHEKAIVVASEKFGWGFMRRDCIKTIPKGGPKKYADTVPGMNPNAKRKKHKD